MGQIDLRSHIREYNVNVTALAKELNISRGSLYNWIENPTPQQYNKIVQAINILADSSKIGIVKESAVEYNSLKELKTELQETKKLLSLTLQRIDNLEKENNKINSEKISLIQANKELEKRVKHN